jgi:hypothetical protein
MGVLGGPVSWQSAVHSKRMSGKIQHGDPNDCTRSAVRGRQCGAPSGTVFRAKQEDHHSARELIRTIYIVPPRRTPPSLTNPRLWQRMSPTDVGARFDHRAGTANDIGP